jgi:glucose/arabinose dehydrogenase
MKRITLLLCLLTLLPLPGYSASPRVIQSETVAFILEKVTDGLRTPWGLAFISDTRLLITEREGSIKLLDTQSKTLTPVQGAPAVLAEGQGGLMDVAVPPDFTAGDWIYFTFVRNKDGEGVTVLARAKLRSNQLVQWQDLLETRSATDTGRHFGSRIAFDEKAYVYFGVGDRGERPTAQDLGNHAGSVMRLFRDGRVPHDNPFNQRTDVPPEIWSYGHRNPQGMAYDHGNRPANPYTTPITLVDHFKILRQ